MVGRVRLARGATLPRYSLADLERRPRDPPQAIEGAPECVSADPLGLSPLAMDRSRALANVVVAASGFTSFADRATKTHRARIEGCALSPPTIAAMDGDRLLIENASGHAYQPLFGVRVHAETLQPGETREYPLVGGGIESVMCTAQARCGRSDVVVFHHPVHAVTDSAGRFRIDDFPTGQVVYLSAWHPLSREASTAVWLEPGERREVELTLQPRDPEGEEARVNRDRSR